MHVTNGVFAGLIRLLRTLGSDKERLTHAMEGASSESSPLTAHPHSYAWEELPTQQLARQSYPATHVQRDADGKDLHVMQVHKLSRIVVGG